MDWTTWLSSLGPDRLALLIPIVAIVCVFLTGTVLGISKLLLHHRERMAMIERGMHPDLIEPEEDETV